MGEIVWCVKGGWGRAEAVESLMRSISVLASSAMRMEKLCKGERARNLYSRGKEHTGNFGRKAKESIIFKHNGVDLNCKTRVFQLQRLTFKTRSREGR